MSTIKSDHKDTIVRMITNTLPYILVRWVEADQLEILEENASWGIFDSNKIDLSDYCRPSEIDQLAEHFNNISPVRSDILFSLKSNGRQFSVYGNSISVEGEKLSMWVKTPDISRPIAYLQDAVHDMKAPINAIIGVANLMQYEMESGKGQDEMKMYVDLIKSNASASVGLINEVMELGEMESSNYHLQKEVVDLGDFLEVYLNTHRLLTLKKKISVDFRKESGRRVKINKMKMIRVMDNVISNAVKFSGHGSSIYVSMHSDVSSETIVVRDEGIGMSETILSQLFVKFGAAKRKGLDGENSNGLGMSIIKQIMELQGGSIEIESEEGKGTIVKLKLRSV